MAANKLNKKTSNEDVKKDSEGTEVRDNMTFQTQVMYDAYGSYQISKFGDSKYQFKVLSINNEKGDNYPVGQEIDLKIVEQFPHGYTIARGPDGKLFDFNENDNNIMGKLVSAYKVHSSGSYITERDQGDAGKTYSYVSGKTQEDGMEHGQRKQITQETFDAMQKTVETYNGVIKDKTEERNHKRIDDFASKINMGPKRTRRDKEALMFNRGGSHHYAEIQDSARNSSRAEYLDVFNGIKEPITVLEKGENCSFYQSKEFGPLVKFKNSKDKGNDKIVDVDYYEKISENPNKNSAYYLCAYDKDEYGDDEYEEQAVLLSDSGDVCMLSTKETMEFSRVREAHRKELAMNRQGLDEATLEILSEMKQEKN